MAEKKKKKKEGLRNDGLCTWSSPCGPGTALRSTFPSPQHPPPTLERARLGVMVAQCSVPACTFGSSHSSEITFSLTTQRVLFHSFLIDFIFRKLFFFNRKIEQIVQRVLIYQVPSFPVTNILISMVHCYS